MVHLFYEAVYEAVYELSTSCLPLVDKQTTIAFIYIKKRPSVNATYNNVYDVVDNS
jgi:hypothetical protein